MRAWQVIFILVLAGAIFGPAGYFIYQIVYEPKLKRERDIAEEARIKALPPPPDPALPVLQEALRLKNANDLPGAKAALEDFIENHPKSSVLNDAKQHLGEINTTIYLTSRPSPDKEEYIVKPGDTLLKVQRQTRAPVELIMRSNSLPSINLQIGQKLYVPKADFTITINMAAERIELFNSGKFFKQYSFDPVNLPPAKAQGSKTKVLEKAAWWQNERITFEDKNYNGSCRWVVLRDGTTIFSPAPESWGLADPARGFRLKQHEVAEIQALIKPETPVTIIP